MNEAETRAEYIDFALKAAVWGVVSGNCILRERPITLGRIEGFGRRSKPDIADYVLVYRNHKLAVAGWGQAQSPVVGLRDFPKGLRGNIKIRSSYNT